MSALEEVVILELDVAVVVQEVHIVSVISLEKVVKVFGRVDVTLLELNVVARTILMAPIRIIAITITLTIPNETALIDFAIEKRSQERRSVLFENMVSLFCSKIMTRVPL